MDQIIQLGRKRHQIKKWDIWDILFDMEITAGAHANDGTVKQNNRVEPTEVGSLVFPQAYVLTLFAHRVEIWSFL